MANGITLRDALGNSSLKQARVVIGVLFGQRLRPLWLLAVGAWVLFGCVRVGLLIASRDVVANVGAAEVLRGGLDRLQSLQT